MNNENQKLVEKFNYFVRAVAFERGVDRNSETESVVGDNNWLVENNDPITTGISCFSDIPEIQVEDENGVEWVDKFDSVEEYWDYLTDLHVEDIPGEFREDSRGVLWYHDDEGGWLRVYEDGELLRDREFDSPDEVDEDLAD
jgi:hypothetical protein